MSLETLKKFILWVLAFVVVCLIGFSNVFADTESFWSKTTLGRVGDSGVVQMGSISSQNGRLQLHDAIPGYDSVYFPLWLGFYGNATNNFVKDKAYSLQFQINYQMTDNNFNWKKYAQFANMQIAINNVVVKTCNLSVNTNSFSVWQCQFVVSQDTSSYYEFNINWYGIDDLLALNVGGLQGSSGNSLIDMSLTLTSSTDNSGTIVSQNEVIIGQNQQIIDATHETNNKLDEAENTRKGILATLKDLVNDIVSLPKKIVDFLIDALKSLFIPSDDFFTNWLSDFSDWIHKKLGLLLTPIDIFVDFVSAYLNLSDNNDVIINIPNITVPNFEDNVIIQAQSFNWTELLNSKHSLRALWLLYLDFIDVFIIFNFIGLCEVTYARIFGGDTTQYNYYTIEDSYDVDVDTGEVSKMKHKEKITHREKRL